MKQLFSVIAFISLVAGLSAAQPAAAIPSLGVGASVPDVKIHNAGGQEVSLHELVTRQPTVLVFYRGSWCPYCMKHLAALAELQPQLVAAGFQLVAISADQSSLLAKTPGQDHRQFALYSDNRMEAAKSFGITFEVPSELVAKYKNEYHVDLEAYSGQTHHLLPHPAVFITDKAGVIRFAHVNPDFRVRLTAEEILAAIKSVK